MRLISNRKASAFAALFIAGSITFSSVPVYADTISDLENESAGIESQLASIDNELIAISSKILETEAQIAITDSEMQRTEDMLEQSVIEEEQQYEAMKSRIKYMYESGTSSLIEMLFSAEDLADFVNKADFVQSVSEYDRNMLTELQDIKTEIISQKENISSQKESLYALKNELVTNEASLAQRANELSINLDEFNAKINMIKEENRKQEEAQNQKPEPKPDSPQQDNSKHDNEAPDNHTTDSQKPAPKPDNPSPDVNVSELELFAALLQCEAHQDYNSLLAVATVIMNRVESPRFPNNIHDVIYAPGQFEPTWTGRLDRVLSKGATALSRQVAQDAINGKRLSSVSDCYYFLYAPSTSRQGIIVGDNLFFKSW